MKIGLGIVTYNRKDFFLQALNSVPTDIVDEIVVVNDGTPYDIGLDEKIKLIQHEKNTGVGIAKNDALKHLYEVGCDYIFLMEDDIIIKDPTVFEQYIKLHKASNIHHFNFGYHGPANKTPDKKPNPKLAVNYKEADIKLVMNQHCVGAFSFYTRECIDKCGYIDEKFINAWEHVEHTYRIIKAGMTTPFWWFADLANSYDYLDELACSEDSSTIRDNPNWKENIIKGNQYFYSKHGCIAVQIPDVGQMEVIKYVKEQKDGN